LQFEKPWKDKPSAFRVRNVRSVQASQRKLEATLRYLKLRIKAFPQSLPEPCL
jgi:hypothetical protein